MSNYETLVRILDQIRKEASAQYKSYYPLETDVEKLNQSRSKAFIHLFLKVKFGLLDFEERQQYITDGIDDGGIDGYYTDTEEKKIYLIQSKFRVSEVAFKNKEIELQEILKMDTERIMHGETCYEDGKAYNGKIQALLKRIQSIADIALYKWEVVILANLTTLSQAQLKKLVGGFPTEILNFERCYDELVFPVVTGTYYSARDVFVYLNLTQKSLGSRIRYTVDTEFGECEITVVFVPTIEIAKIMHKYKNSILKFNPRSYLDLTNNPVNLQIAKTIREKETNEFALFNNGITVLSDETHLTEQTGLKNIAQLKLTNPQIINGGQTAYTLSKIYEDELKSGEPEKYFTNKEVLLKVVTLMNGTKPENGAETLHLIESVSKATNEQTAVTDADRRSNDKVQIEIQKRVYNEFGCFYERKRGEFWNGRKDGYVDQGRIINRELFLRICVACNGMPAQARRNSERVLVNDNKFYGTLGYVDRVREFYFGFVCYDALNEIQKKFEKIPHNRYGVINYGNALRYGKFAVVSVACKKLSNEIKNEALKQRAEEAVNECLNKWLVFEKHISALEHNGDYFVENVDTETGQVTYEVNYDNYYKGRTLNGDLKEYFSI